MLRKKGVVGKFVEFFGPGVGKLPLADRATIGNMAPEYGATCGFFPIDEVTLDYLRLTGRAPERVALVEAYAKAQGMWRHDGMADPVFTDTLELDLATVEPSLAGPKRPQDRVALKAAKQSFEDGAGLPRRRQPRRTPRCRSRAWTIDLRHGDVVIAAITSCTNTSNPGRDDRGRPGRQEGGRAGPDPQALGQDLAGPGLARGHRLSGQGRPAALPRPGRLRSGRLWLHHLHRQFRPAAGRDRRGGHRRQAGGGGGALGQPQLRGPRPRPGQGQLPGLAAAGRRLRAGRLDADRHHHRAPGHGQGRQARSTSRTSGRRRRRSTPRCARR